MKLNEKEINVINKLIDDAHMDWFSLRETDKGNAYVYDIEEHRRMTFKEAFTLFVEGICDLSILNQQERITFELLKGKVIKPNKAELIEQLTSIKENSESFICDDCDQIWFDDLVAIDIAIDLVKRYYKEG